jgi:Protein of unknown function (DUF2911)
MKKIVLFLFAILLAGKTQAQVNTPSLSPQSTVKQQIGLAHVSIDYGRPSLRGRSMFGTTRIPFGKIWRTGADAATTVVLSADVYWANQLITKGKYLLATIPGPEEWTLIINKNPNQWGTFEYKESEDVLRLKVKVQPLAKPVETFTFDFVDLSQTSATLQMRWEKTQISVPIRHDADAQVMAEIEQKMTQPDSISTSTLYDAANYYYNNNKDLKKALIWADQLVQKEPAYWTYYVQAKIAAKLKQCNVAVPAAEKGLALAKKDGDDAYVANHQAVLQDCKK